MISRSSFSELENMRSRLSDHPMYECLQSRKDLVCFMESHVFAVWDFMSLLKSLQGKITCLSVPWRPSSYSGNLVRWVHEIVTCEESDLDGEGGYTSHFELYLKAMSQIGASQDRIFSFLKEYDFRFLPSEVSNFVKFHLDLSQYAPIHHVAAAFCFGREKIVPEMFRPILNRLESLDGFSCEILKFYLSRHIHVDDQEHGHKSEDLLWALCEEKEDFVREAIAVARESLALRAELWNGVHRKLKRQ